MDKINKMITFTSMNTQEETQAIVLVSPKLTDMKVVKAYHETMGNLNYLESWEDENQSYFDTIDWTVIFYSVETIDIVELEGK